jgi:hypothetical protein
MAASSIANKRVPIALVLDYADFWSVRSTSCANSELLSVSVYF